jgi:hypothetical protein
MKILIFLIAAGHGPALLTAPGSFFLDGFQVWNNASVVEGSRIETKNVAARLTLPGQEVRIEAGSIVKLLDHRLIVEKGCAQLSQAGTYSLEGGHPPCLHEIRLTTELRPLSQRP